MSNTVQNTSPYRFPIFHEDPEAPNQATEKTNQSAETAFHSLNNPNPSPEMPKIPACAAFQRQAPTEEKKSEERASDDANYDKQGNYKEKSRSLLHPRSSSTESSPSPTSILASMMRTPSPLAQPKPRPPAIQADRETPVQFTNRAYSTSLQSPLPKVAAFRSELQSPILPILAEASSIKKS